MSDNPSFPSYTPTPIRILEQASKSVSSFEYNPTPINELEQYAPTNLPSTVTPTPLSFRTAGSSSYYNPVSTRPPTPTASKVASESPKPASQTPTESSLSDESPDSREAKRQKLLALYCDLYGDDESDRKTRPVQPQSKSLRISLPKSAVASATSSSFAEKVKSESSSTPSSSHPRPTQPLRPSNKIPMPIRKRYLDQFCEACLRLCASPPEAYDMALREEQACHDRALNRQNYLHAVINCMMKFKNQPSYVAKPAASTSKSSVQGDKNNADKQPKVPENDLDKMVKGPAFYNALKPFLLTEKQLVENKFPRPDPSEGAPRTRAFISVPADKKWLVECFKTNKRQCKRCGKSYEVDEFGMATVQTQCVYHWGKPVRKKMPGRGFELAYTCCGAESGVEGCELAPGGHVHEINKWCDLDDFLTTLPPPTDANPDRVNVYALDCEMVHTTFGLELARVTVVDANLETVVDVVVRPFNRVIDPNTRFSGLTMADLEAAQLRITDVRMQLLQLWDEESILIGHSLDSDLTALKFIHSKVVDTSVVFPHRRGPPYKRALRNIVGDYLHEIIQNDEAGHDSKEDAVACMRLMQKKVKEVLSMKIRRTAS